LAHFHNLFPRRRISPGRSYHIRVDYNGSLALWNFSSNITFISTGRQFDGALMALNANLSNSNDQDGAVFVKSMTAGSEVHLPLYDGFVPAASVPEPSSIAMLSASTIFGLGYWLRRRRAENRQVTS
jgi:hypothetical protein